MRKVLDCLAALCLVLVFFVSTPLSAQQGVDGRNVTTVNVSAGSFRMVAPGRWVEQGNDGAQFNFVESGRDDSSVYLTDTSRGVELQLDLQARTVFYSDRNTPKQPLYQIVSASADQTTPENGGQAEPQDNGSAVAPNSGNDAQAILNGHNAYRAKHCVPPLSWSAEVAQVAQNWANRCVFEHSSGSGFGENLWMGTSGFFSAQSVVDSWYSEIDRYDFANPGFSPGTGHFTQVIWAGSTQLGCAAAECNGQTMWVCNYSPAGNFTGQYPQNVPQACR